MSYVLCDLSAWLAYGSRVQMKPLSTQEARRVLEEAKCSLVGARLLEEQPWYREMLFLDNALTRPIEGERAPASLLVGRVDRRSRKGGVECRVLEGEIPPYSIMELFGPLTVGEPLYVVSPGLYFVLRARELPFDQLVLLGEALTACYTARPDMSDGLVRRSSPLITVAKLDAYLSSWERPTRGVSKARSVIPYICGGAYSPMEPTLAMLLWLPKRMGGLGFPKPLLNCEISLPPDISRMAGGQTSVKFDVWIPGSKEAVEYDGKDHNKPDAVNHDKNRRLAAHCLGYTVHVVTGAVLYDEQKFRTFARMLGERVGHDPSLSSSELLRHRRLRSLLLERHVWW